MDISDLVRGLKRNDKGAFEALVLLYGDRLFGFTTGMLGSQVDAEDAVQETFIRVFRSIGRYVEEGRFDAWIFRIARRIAIDLIRKRKGLSREISGDGIGWAGLVSSDGQGPEMALHAKELKDVLDTAVDRLSAEQREVFLLRTRSDLSFREIAEITGVSVNTALGRMHYAVEVLRKRLDCVGEKR